jgi:HD-GYP domain-containing protein (c-di-GMP phosphodiesterase class II)
MKLTSEAHMRENWNGHLELLRWRAPTGYTAALTALLMRLEAKDPATTAHSRAVQAIAEVIATAMGVDIGDGGLVHDLGKLDVPAPLLQKRGRLTAAEFETIEEHSRHGYRLLHPISPGLASIVMMIHERPDGTGYPFGVREVPVEAGIIAAADALHALVADRPYRPGRPFDEALPLLLAGAGSQFRPDVVAALSRCQETLRTVVARVKPAAAVATAC